MENKNYLEADSMFESDEEVKKLVNAFGVSPKELLALRMLFNAGYEKAHNILEERENRFYKKLNKVDSKFLIDNIEDLYNLSRYLDKNYADKEVKTKLIQIMTELSSYLANIFNDNN